MKQIDDSVLESYKKSLTKTAGLATQINNRARAIVVLIHQIFKQPVPISVEFSAGYLWRRDFLPDLTYPEVVYNSSYKAELPTKMVTPYRGYYGVFPGSFLSKSNDEIVAIIEKELVE